MSIRLVRADIFHYRYKLAQPIPSTMGPFSCRPAILLRLEDADGAHGWGEIWCNFPPDGDLHRARLAANVLPAALAGLDATARNGPFAQIAARLHRIALQAGEIGPVAQIAAGVDIAVHDLAARRDGRPLADYLAHHRSGTRLAVPAYASGLSPDRFEGQIARMRAMGYAHFKQRIGFGRDDSLAEAEAAAAGLGRSERIMLDANQAWDLASAIARVERIERLNPLFLEEPLPADVPVADWQVLAAATEIPLAAGENLRRPEEFATAIDGGALRILQPDACKWGGLSACLAVARAGLKKGIVYFPHYLGGGVGLMASAHLLAAAGGDGMLEVDSSENPLLEHFSAAGLGLRNGLFPLPDAPGLGYEPDIAGASGLLHAHHDIAIRD